MQSANHSFPDFETLNDREFGRIARRIAPAHAAGLSTGL
jgi:hypothetical protein